MKQSLRLFFSLLLTVCGISGINAQQFTGFPERYFQYQNNGDFNSFLFENVDSIVYSKLDLDSVLHDDIVVQEVWTRDTVYRYQIQTIDSISFERPETKMRDNLFYITDRHVPYTLKVDSLVITFEKSIASDMLPQVGQVVMTQTELPPYENGFAGRVKEINMKNGNIVIEFEAVTIADLYSKAFFSGSGINGGTEEMKNKARLRREMVQGGSKEDNPIDIIPSHLSFSLPLGLWSIDIDNLQIEHQWYLYTNDANYTFNLDAYIYVENVKMKTKINTSMINSYMKAIKAGEGLSNWSQIPNMILEELEKKEEDDQKEKRFKITGPMMATFSLWKVLDLNIGMKMELKGDVSLEQTSTTAGNFHFNYNLSGNLKKPKLPDVQWNVENNMEPFKEDYSGEIKGTLKVAPTIEVVAKPIIEQLAYIKLGAEMGWEAEGALKFNLNELKKARETIDKGENLPYNNDYLAYMTLKDSYLNTSLYSEAKLDLSFLYSLLNWTPLKKEGKRPLTKRFLLPEVRKPKLLNYADEEGDMKYEKALTSDLRRDVLFAINPGIELFDKDGHTLGSEYVMTDYRTEWQWKPENLRVNLGNYPEGTTLTAIPFILLGPPFNTHLTLDAPEMRETVTIPKQMEVAENVVNMYPNTQKYVAINGGWDKIVVTSSNPDLVKATKIEVPSTGARGVLIESKEREYNPSFKASVYVRDLRGRSSREIQVRVANEFPGVPLSAEELTLDPGESADVEILDGSGNYKLDELSYEESPKAVLDGNIIHITGNGYATWHIKVHDLTNNTYGIITVITQEKNSITLSDSEQELFVGEKKQVYIKRGSGSYRIVNESPDVCRGELTDLNRQHEVTIMANSPGTAKVNVQDLNTGDYATVVVTVKSRQWQYATDSQGDYYNIDGAKFKMVNVEGGSYTMGADVDDKDDEIYYPKERPAHRVKLSDFQIGETEVTNELWDAVMGKDYQCSLRISDVNNNFPDDNPLSPQQPVSFNRNNHLKYAGVVPMEIDTFLVRLNAITGKHFRLPTEAEWEYAAKGGTKGNNYLYPGSNYIGEVAQVYRHHYDGYEKVWRNELIYVEGNYNPLRKFDVAQKHPNELGLYDMVGNVSELCYDMDTYTQASQTDPQPTFNSVYRWREGLMEGYKVLMRGGGYGSGKALDPLKDPEFKYRNCFRMTGRYSDNFWGLRLAMGGPLKVSENNVEVELFKESKKIAIVMGSGNYTVSSKNPEIAVPNLENNNIVITSLSGGQTTVIVKDLKTGQTADITVNIPYNKEFQLETREVLFYTYNHLYGKNSWGKRIKWTGGNGKIKIECSNPGVVYTEYDDWSDLYIYPLTEGETNVAITDLGSQKTENIKVKVFKNKFNVERIGSDSELANVGDQMQFQLSEGSGAYMADHVNKEGFSVELRDNIATVTMTKSLKNGSDTITFTDKGTNVIQKVVVNQRLKISCKDGYLPVDFSKRRIYLYALKGDRRTISIDQGCGNYRIYNTSGDHFTAQLDGNQVIVQISDVGWGEFSIKQKSENSFFYIITISASEPIKLEASEVSIDCCKDVKLAFINGSDNLGFASMENGKEELFKPNLESDTNPNVIGEDLEVVAEARGKMPSNSATNNDNPCFKAFVRPQNSSDYGLYIRGVTAGTGSATLLDRNTGSTCTVKVNVKWQDLQLKDTLLTTVPWREVETTILSGNGDYSLEIDHPETATVSLNKNGLFTSITFRAEQSGEYLVTVTENNTGAKKTLKVIVYNYLKLAWESPGINLALGEIFNMNIVGSGKYAIDIDDGEVCSVVANGDVITFTALKIGGTIVTFRDLITEASQTLWVEVLPALVLPVDQLILDHEGYTYLDISSGSGKYEAKAEDESIVFVSVRDSQIAFFPYKAGTTTITITDKITGQTQQINVTVNPSAFAGFSLDKQSLELLVGRPTEVKVIGDAMIDVISSDESVATIHNFGESFWVYPIAPGGCIITVTNKQSLEKIELPVTVYPAIELDACRESSDEGAYFTAVEQGKTLTIAITKGSGHYQIIYEHESHAGNVRIEGSNVLVTGVNADAQDGIYGFKVLDEKTSAEALVNVRVVPVGQFELKFAEPTMELAIGEEKTINASVKNWMVIDDAINNESVITLESIVTYRDHYEYSIKGLAEGTSTFTLYDKVSRQTAILTVTVRENSTTYPDLQLYKYNVEEAVSTTECVGIVSGSGSYQVESSNDNIAEAKLNWQLVCILAKAPGTATITVTDLKTGQVKTIYVKVHDGQSGQDEIWKSKIADLWYEFDKLREELKEKATEEEAPELYAMLRDIDSYISAMDSDWRNGKFASLEKYETDIKQRLEQLKKAIDALGK